MVQYSDKVKETGKLHFEKYLMKNWAGVQKIKFSARPDF